MPVQRLTTGDKKALVAFMEQKDKKYGLCDYLVKKKAKHGVFLNIFIDALILLYTSHDSQLINLEEVMRKILKDFKPLNDKIRGKTKLMCTPQEVAELNKFNVYVWNVINLYREDEYNTNLPTDQDLTEYEADIFNCFDVYNELAKKLEKQAESVQNVVDPDAPPQAKAKTTTRKTPAKSSKAPKFVDENAQTGNTTTTTTTTTNDTDETTNNDTEPPKEKKKGRPAKAATTTEANTEPTPTTTTQQRPKPVTMRKIKPQTQPQTQPVNNDTNANSDDDESSGTATATTSQPKQNLKFNKIPAKLMSNNRMPQNTYHNVMEHNNDDDN